MPVCSAARLAVACSAGLQGGLQGFRLTGLCWHLVSLLCHIIPTPDPQTASSSSPGSPSLCSPLEWAHALSGMRAGQVFLSDSEQGHGSRSLGGFGPTPALPQWRQGQQACTSERRSLSTLVRLELYVVTIEILQSTHFG